MAEGRSELEIDQEIADRWGHLSGARGATVPVTDGLLAATAIHHSLKLVTRNTKGHDANRRRTFNPWPAKAIVGRGTQMNYLNYESPCMRLLTA